MSPAGEPAFEVTRSWRVPILPWIVLVGWLPWSVFVYALALEGKTDHLTDPAAAGFAKTCLGLAFASAMALALSYWALAHIFNRTVFRIAHGALTVRHGPLPWPGNCTISIAAITDVVCEHRRIRTRNGWIDRFDVLAIMREGPPEPLARDLREERDAQSIAASLRARLGTIS